MKENSTKNFISRLIQRPQEPLSLLVSIRSGIKSFISLTILAAISQFAGDPLIMAPFAATSIIIFTSPEEKFSQPMNIIFGYIIATTIGIIATNTLPHEWWTLGLMLAVTISIMAYFRVTHPPAGSIPLIIYLYHDGLTFNFVLFPVLTGALILIICGILLHKVPKQRQYPAKLIDKKEKSND